MAVQIPIVSEFDGTGVKKAVQQFKQLEGAGAKAQFALKKAAVPAAAALAGLTAGLVDATKGAIEDEAAQKALAGQLKRTTGATDAQISSVEDWISAQGKAFGIADDKLRPALSKLATASKDVTRAQQLARTAMDIAAATGRDYESVVAALTKAEIGQYASLKKLGLPIGDNTRALMDMAKETKAVHKAQTDLDNAMARNDKKDIIKATENLAKAQQRLNAVTVEGADYVTDLNAAFGGAATQAANTAQGAFKRLKVSLDETKESIGASLIPVVEKALPKLTEFASWAQDNPETFRNVAGGIAAIAAAIVATNAAMATNPLVLLAGGATALVLGFNHLADAMDRINRVGGFALRLAGYLLSIGQLGKLLDYLPGGGKETPTVPSGAKVPKMAAGGVVTAPTLALVGEAGPEAIVPLSKMGQMGGNVTIHVNGGDPQAVVDALVRWSKANGALPSTIRAA